MPYANPEDKKRNDRERKQRPEVKERHREQYRKRYAENTNDVASKVREKHYFNWNSPEYRAASKERSRLRWERDWSGQTLAQIKSRAKIRGLEFNLEACDLVLPSHCPIFGIPLSRTQDRQTNNSPSVDRIDNSKGYVKGNVVVISLKANAIKRDTTLAELKKMVEFYENLERLKNE